LCEIPDIINSREEGFILAHGFIGLGSIDSEPIMRPNIMAEAACG
jgi:hypothetical protein